jgi:hypothetical protein
MMQLVAPEVVTEMFADNAHFKKPDNENEIIWRYMDLPKFVSLVDRKALFFIRLDRLQKMDRFEGALTKPTVEQMNSTESHKIIQSTQTKEQQEAGNRRFIEFRNLYRKTCVVNCWHMNENESDAMWGLYATRQAGIAIKSTFKRLRDSFDGQLGTILSIHV